MFTYESYEEFAKMRGACQHEQRRFATYNAGRFLTPEEAWKRWEPHRLKAERDYCRTASAKASATTDAAVARFMSTLARWSAHGGPFDFPLESAVVDALDSVSAPWGQRGAIGSILRSKYRLFCTDYKQTNQPKGNTND